MSKYFDKFLEYILLMDTKINFNICFERISHEFRFSSINKINPFKFIKAKEPIEYNYIYRSTDLQYYCSNCELYFNQLTWANISHQTKKNFDELIKHFSPPRRLIYYMRDVFKKKQRGKKNNKKNVMRKQCMYNLTWDKVIEKYCAYMHHLLWSWFFYAFCYSYVLG